MQFRRLKEKLYRALLQIWGLLVYNDNNFSLNAVK